MRKCRTVKTVQMAIKAQTGSSGIFSATFQNATQFNWIKPYCVGVDNLLTIEKGNLTLIPALWVNEQPTDTELTALQLAVAMEMISHEYELKKLIATLDFEYNPIHNVDEDTTEIYTGDGTSRNERKENGEGGSKSKNTTDDISNISYGSYQEKTDNTIGSETDTGSITNTNQYGNTAGQVTISNNVAPMDSDIFHSDTQSIDNHNADAHNDTLKQESSSTIGAREDKSVHTIDSREDINDRTIDGITSSSYSNQVIANVEGITSTSYSKHIIRKGNIGVKSSQALIVEEREIARFSIYQEIINIFTFALCNGVYTDTDSVARDIYERGEGFYDDYIL